MDQHRCLNELLSCTKQVKPSVNEQLLRGQIRSESQLAIHFISSAEDTMSIDYQTFSRLRDLIKWQYDELPVQSIKVNELLAAHRQCNNAIIDEHDDYTSPSFLFSTFCACFIISSSLSNSLLAHTNFPFTTFQIANPQFAK